VYELLASELAAYEPLSSDFAAGLQAFRQRARVFWSARQRARAEREKEVPTWQRHRACAHSAATSWGLAPWVCLKDGLLVQKITPKKTVLTLL